VTRPTERRNPATHDIDIVSTGDALELILDEDAHAVSAVNAALPDIVGLVELARERILDGGTLHYFGAGASGRLALLDATELHPTFGFPRDRMVAHFPGGAAAFVDSSIDREDARDSGAADAAGLRTADLAIGVSASGSTPYVAGALTAARQAGARTALITNTPGAQLSDLADQLVVIDTGPEAVTGSTRMKAGTATKVALNAFSTALMIRLGRTYSNLMIGLAATNDKLAQRAVRILVEATGLPDTRCAGALAEAGGDIAIALVMLRSGENAVGAARALRAHGSVREALGER
jgi:N-acetylmuramic acid 6-phosphate etherase